MPKRYVNVKLPVELGDEVVEKKLMGYRSRAEFVAEAVRDKLMQVKRSFQKKTLRKQPFLDRS